MSQEKLSFTPENIPKMAEIAAREVKKKKDLEKKHPELNPRNQYLKKRKENRKNLKNKFGINLLNDPEEAKEVEAEERATKYRNTHKLSFSMSGLKNYDKIFRKDEKKEK